MNKQQMEEVWNGKLVNTLKINKFLDNKYHVYTYRMDVFKKEKIDTFEISKPCKSEKVALKEIPDELRKWYATKHPQWDQTYTTEIRRVYKE